MKSDQSPEITAMKPIIEELLKIRETLTHGSPQAISLSNAINRLSNVDELAKAILGMDGETRSAICHLVFSITNKQNELQEFTDALNEMHEMVTSSPQVYCARSGFLLAEPLPTV